MDTAFFLASKAVGLALRVEVWVLLLLILGLWRPWARLTALVLVCVLTLFPVARPLLHWLETQSPPRPALPATVDGIIVLGGGEDFAAFAVHGMPGVNGAGERLIAGAELALAHPGARLIFTGGIGGVRGALGRADHTGPARMTEALWVSLGVDPARIEVEDRSRTTSENARLLHDDIAPQPGQTWILVTSAWHMPRSLDTFQRAGWDGIVPWPVDYRAAGPEVGVGVDLAGHVQDFNIAIKEVVGALGYRLAGR